MTAPGELLTLSDAAARLRVHYMTAYHYVRVGRLPAVRRGGRWYVAAQDVTSFAQARAQVVPAATRGGVDWDAHRSRLFDTLVAGDEPAAWPTADGGLRDGRPGGGLHPHALPGTERGRCRVGSREAEHCGRAPRSPWSRRDWSASRPTLPPARDGPVVAWSSPAPPGERHALPVAMVADVLRAHHWTVVDLGADVPSNELRRTSLGTDRLRAVGISVIVPGNDAAVRDAVVATKEAVPRVAVILGGAAIKDHATARALGADAWAADALELCALLDELPDDSSRGRD